MWWKRQIRSWCHYSNYFSSRIPVECPGDLQGPQTALWDLLVSWISCICFGPSGSVALNSQVISLVLKIKSNIIQKSISGPFSISQGSCHDSPYMHEYSLPTPVLFTSLKVPEPFLCRDTLYAMLCFVLLVFYSGKFCSSWVTWQIHTHSSSVILQITSLGRLLLLLLLSRLKVV